MNNLIKSLNLQKSEDGIITLKQWNITAVADNDELLFDWFNELLVKEVPIFENTINNSNKYEEGEIQRYKLNKYERNRAARAECLRVHGNACKICGFDFGSCYGKEFAGLIEVHHVVPISEIGKQYVVDPVNDLIPVCPNCHTALHSKKDGVYSPDELMKLLKTDKS